MTNNKPTTRALIEFRRSDHQPVTDEPAVLLQLAFARLCQKFKINPSQLKLEAESFRETWRSECHNMVVTGMMSIQERQNAIFARLTGQTAPAEKKTDGGLIVPLGLRTEEEPEEEAHDDGEEPSQSP